jgi:Leucine-rich repeat (LRR) protein
MKMSSKSKKPRVGVGVMDLTFLDISREEDLLDSMAEVLKADERSPASSFKALRLANNEIPKLDLIMGPILSLQFNPSNILWLDLSFNAISSISELIAENFPNITTLYLHANKITKMSDIRKLSGLTKLRSLTMYGNPVEDSKHYHNMMLYAHPQIVQIDFCTITQRQRDQVIG